MNGWIKLNRGLIKHWIWSNEKYLRGWIYILFRANHQPNRILIGVEVPVLHVEIYIIMM
jgi:hypothetical protein